MISVVTSDGVRWTGLTPEQATKERWIQEAMRLAMAWGRFAGGPEFDHGDAAEEWAAFEKHLRTMLVRG